VDSSDIAAAVIMGWLLAFIVITLFAFMRGRRLKMKFHHRIYPHSYYRVRRSYHRRRYLLTLFMSVVVAFAVNYVWRVCIYQ
jgi:uncharacterized membrane protein